MEPVPLLLVPGLMCDATVWEGVIPLLGRHASCTVVDHGAADSLTVMAQQVLSAAPARFALAAHSMGGRVAAEMVRLAPERVERLAVFDTGYRARAAGAGGEAEARGRFDLLEVARTRGVRAMAQEWVLGMVAPARLADSAFIETILSMFARKSADIFERQIQALLNRPDATPALRGVQVPALVLCGREDSWAPVAQHEEISALMPGKAVLEVVEGAGHMSTMEQPQAVARAMVGWLQRSLA